MSVDNIAGLKVTEVKNDSVWIGLNKVPKSELTALIAEMNATPPDKNFEITRLASSSGYIKFSIRHKDTGWISAGGKQESSEMEASNMGYANKSAHLCLNNEQAIKFFRFLAKELNFEVYPLPAVIQTYHFKNVL